MAHSHAGRSGNQEAARGKSGSAQSDLTLKEAHTLLAAARPSAVLSLLKDPNFAMIAAIAFMGFRVDSRSYANPLVRRRLAEEAVRNAGFAQKLRDLADEPKPPPQPLPPRATPPPLLQPIPTPAMHDPSEKYRAERDRLRHERDTALEARRKAEQDYGKARAGQLAAQTARAEADREAERLRQRLERLERRLRRLESENAALSRATAGAFSGANTSRPNTADNRPVQAPPNKAAQSERRFADAIRHLLDKEKWALAEQIASDVLRAAPDDPEALAIRARAQEGKGHIKEAIADLRRLVPAEIARGDASGALHALFHLLRLSSRPASESRLVREVYSALATDPSVFQEAREILARLKAVAPQAYQLIKDHAPGDLARSLFDPEEAGSLALDDPLPLAPLHGLTLTARRLVAAVDRNDIPIVTSARNSLRGLGAEALKPIEEVLRRAGGGEDSYFQLLARSGANGAVVVDASNVAWHGQEMIVGGRPRIAHLLALRAALRERGYFPIVMIADANLPYVIDDPARVRQMEHDGELALTPSGTDADEHILREARRLNAPVVTNDYMADWDPNQTVGKVQYDISLVDGRATLYF